MITEQISDYIWSKSNRIGDYGANWQLWNKSVTTEQISTVRSRYLETLNEFGYPLEMHDWVLNVGQ